MGAWLIVAWRRAGIERCAGWVKVRVRSKATALAEGVRAKYCKARAGIGTAPCWSGG